MRCAILVPLCVALAVGAAPSVVLDVDWPSYLARHDPTWAWDATMPGYAAADSWATAPFGGNAMLGFLVWQTDAATLRVEVSRADVSDDRSRNATPGAAAGDWRFDAERLPIGHLRVALPGPATASTGRITLVEGRATYAVATAAGNISLALWASANSDLADVIVVDIDGAEAAWVPAAARPATTFPGYVPNPPVESETAATRYGRLNTTVQRHLRGTAHATAVLSANGTYVVAVSPVVATPALAKATAANETRNALELGLPPESGATKVGER